jgi:hypothetical protein
MGIETEKRKCFPVSGAVCWWRLRARRDWFGRHWVGRPSVVNLGPIVQRKPTEPAELLVRAVFTVAAQANIYSCLRGGGRALGVRGGWGYG